MMNRLEGIQKVRFTSQKEPHAMTWASVTPCRAKGSLLPNTNFRCLLRFNLGLPVDPGLSSGAQNWTCPHCNAKMDINGHHLICCKLNGIVRRHGVVQDFLFRNAQKRAPNHGSSRR